ncbi:MAG: hypothetical protein V4719_03775 [Planctomycetota bacterium]
MSLTDQLLQILLGMAGYSGPAPQTVGVTEPADVHLELDVTSADRFSCGFRELRLNVPPFTHTASGQLKQWADDVCQRVTYLLEQLDTIEFDPQTGQVQIRSTRPDRQADHSRYYEIVLQMPGQLRLCRYQTVPGLPREQIDLQITHEVLRKLVPDLVQTALTGK